MEEDSSEWEEEEEIPLSQVQIQLKEENWQELVEIDMGRSEKKELPLSQPPHPLGEGEIVGSEERIVERLVWIQLQGE